MLRDPETYSSVTGGARPYGGTLLQDLADRGPGAQHDGRPAALADPPAGQLRADAADDPPRRGRSAVAGRGACSTPSSRAAPFDFLVDVAAELPMQMICILLGVPESERHWLFDAIEPQFDFGGSRRPRSGS